MSDVYILGGLIAALAIGSYLQNRDKITDPEDPRLPGNLMMGVSEFGWESPALSVIKQEGRVEQPRQRQVGPIPSMAAQYAWSSPTRED